MREPSSQPSIRQQAEGVRAGAIWAVAVGVIVVGAALVVIAWWLVVAPPDAAPAPAASPLAHELFDRATEAAAVRAAGAARLERYEWVDRAAGVARIPIDRAIDAIVADPKLIGAPTSAIVGKVGR
jgi:hypothetical protein